jgi:hypothetical protein
MYYKNRGDDRSHVFYTLALNTKMALAARGLSTMSRFNYLIRLHDKLKLWRKQGDRQGP